MPLCCVAVEREVGGEGGTPTAPDVLTSQDVWSARRECSTGECLLVWVPEGVDA